MNGLALFTNLMSNPTRRHSALGAKQAPRPSVREGVLLSSECLFSFRLSLHKTNSFN
jgi:hypothetical protein